MSNKLLGWQNEIKKNNILSVQMNLLNKCTSRCKSCRKYTWPDDSMSLEDVARTLNVLSNDFGLNSVVFSGGDPVLYKDLDSVMHHCENLGINYSFITTLITKNEFLLKRMAESSYRIHVSVDSMDGQLYKEIRGVDALDLVCENIEYIQSIRDKKKIPVRISSTISKMNYMEVWALYRYAKEHGCLINFYFLHTWDDLKMDDNEVKRFYEQLEMIAEDEMESKKTISNATQLITNKYDFVRESAKCDKCYLPLVNATINANGDIYPCCKLLDDNGDYGEQLKYVYGNVKDKSETEIKQEFEKRYNRDYPHGDICKECADRYNGILQGLSVIVEDKKEPIFF